MTEPKAMPTTKEIAQTMGVGGPNILKQAEETVKKFNPGQLVKVDPAGPFRESARIVEYDPKNRQYLAVIVNTNAPYHHTGMVLRYNPNYLELI